MMIHINKLTNTWAETLKFLVKNIELAKKGHSGYFFEDIVLEDFDLVEDPFITCCYVHKAGKISTLRKQYLNQNSLSQIFSDKVVEVSMVGGPKWGSTAGNKHCMKSLTVDHTNKTVTINFRNSDFLKKFLVDIYFVKLILSEVGVTGYTYSCNFENLTLRGPFVYLFLNQVYQKEGEKAVRDYLNSENKLIKSFLDHYKSVKGKKVTWKSLERSGRRMAELPVYNIIKEYI